MLSLQSADLPFPLRGRRALRQHPCGGGGHLTDPLNLGGLDVQLKFSGESLGNLYGLTGVLLPNTPPYTTDGHLIARLHQPGGAVFEYQKFDGKIGDNDIHGDLKYVAGKAAADAERRGELRQLRLADLAPPISADSNAAKAGRGEKTASRRIRCCRSEQFDTQNWRKMDADVKFAAARIERQRFAAERFGHASEAEQWRTAPGSLRFGMAGASLNCRSAPRRRQKPTKPGG